MDYLFYSIIGKHAGEDVEKIINRKAKEIDLAGFSLWSAQIDKKSIEQVWELNKNDKVYVLCKVSPRAKDPVKADITEAKIAVGPNGLNQKIPKGIKTTYGKGKRYQAYVVRSYEILQETEEFDFGQFETTLSTGEKKSFAERRETFKRFQNTFCKRNSMLEDNYPIPILVKMELEYPFVVNIE